MEYAAWMSMDTAPTGGTLVLVLMANGDILFARNTNDSVDGPHVDGSHGWFTMDGLEIGYGFWTPIGWLPRDALPPSPVR